MNRSLSAALLAVSLVSAAACQNAGDSAVRDESVTVTRRPTTLAPSTELDATTSTVALEPTEQWRADLLVSGSELPGGGFDLFPFRRMVAMYGSPVTTALGILGEHTPDTAIAELQTLTAQYEGAAVEGEAVIPVVAAFEIIVTVASSEPGADGDYSNEMDIEAVRPWVDAATAAGVYVILDLQPGRTDFLTQAKLFEEFLRLPNVGLALDPEWRIGEDEQHLVRIGSVDAAEVNEVIDWLAELVRDEVLPQKLLVLHQFKVSMLPDRQLIETPPELAVLVHADGQGPLQTKYGTYAALVGQITPPEQELWWGWKNFYDEDQPMATPREVNDLRPLPVVVTFQ